MSLKEDLFLSNIMNEFRRLVTIKLLNERMINTK